MIATNAAGESFGEFLLILFGLLLVFGVLWLWADWFIIQRREKRREERSRGNGNRHSG